MCHHLFTPQFCKANGLLAACTPHVKYQTIPLKNPKHCMVQTRRPFEVQIYLHVSMNFLKLTYCCSLYFNISVVLQIQCKKKCFLFSHIIPYHIFHHAIHVFTAKLCVPLDCQNNAMETMKVVSI